ncbi:MAG: MgtC/SapB family protein [Pseudomonas sp.]
MSEPQQLLGAAAALGIGLLVGLERERRKGEGSDRDFAGLRTFAATALLGYVGLALGGVPLLATIALCLVVLVAIAYWRSTRADPGLTTEIALLLVLLLGALCVSAAGLAVTLGVVLSLLLTYRQWLHRLVRERLSEREFRDGLILATLGLVILPLMPDRFIGPFAALNPRTLCLLVLLIMAISAAGHIAVRLLGPRYGLPLAGLAGGFASSTATVASMGARSRQRPASLFAAAAAAMLSSLATMIQMALVLAAVSWPSLQSMGPSLGLGGALILGYALLLSVRAGQVEVDDGAIADAEAAFDLKVALLLGGAIGLIGLLSAALLAWLGQRGLLLAVSLGGLADAHAAAASAASLVASGQVPVPAAQLAILAALTSNTCSKCVLAWVSGGARFAALMLPGLLLALAALWAGRWLGG